MSSTQTAELQASCRVDTGHRALLLLLLLLLLL
jgi:hypothetical protein